MQRVTNPAAQYARHNADVEIRAPIDRSAHIFYIAADVVIPKTGIDPTSQCFKAGEVFLLKGALIKRVSGRLNLLC